MRNEKRIPIILDFFKNNKQALEEFTGLPTHEIDNLYKHWEDVSKEWKEEPDQRLGQLLINLNLIPDGEVWFVEEKEWLIKRNYIPVEEISFWGRIYGKDGKKLPEREWIPLDKLTTDHIKGILEFFKGKEDNLNPTYLEYFKQRTNGEDKQT